jgi:nicotinamide riboside kinase
MLIPRPVLSTPVRVYLVGSHGTGKTTLARYVRDTYGLPMIAEVARGVLAEMEAGLDALRADVPLVNRYQREVFERQIDAEQRVDGPFVSDRAFCNLAYAAHHSTIMPDRSATRGWRATWTGCAAGSCPSSGPTASSCATTACAPGSTGKR